jgi:hypothetical protein
MSDKLKLWRESTKKHFAKKGEPYKMITKQSRKFTMANSAVILLANHAKNVNADALADVLNEFLWYETQYFSFDVWYYVRFFHYHYTIFMSRYCMCGFIPSTNFVE